jgi:putative GTP pyrophosphokinase
MDIGKKLNQQDFFQRYRIKASEFKKTGLKWSDLQDIFEDHQSRVSQLIPAANYFRDLLQQLPEVHSLKVRVKHPDHVVEKIIRKCFQRPNREITGENYRREITDLVGVRALHLFKDEWLSIHDLISKTWRLKEKPTANIRKGDPEEAFRKAGCVIKEHPAGYRSVHYVVRYQLSRQIQYVELQVRTLFEEAWSEIDHRIRYPHNVDNAVLSQFLIIFNGLAGSADHMGTYIKFLSAQLENMQGQSEAQAANESELQAEIAKLRKYVAKLQISVAEKEKLNERLTSITFVSSQPYLTLNALRVGDFPSPFKLNTSLGGGLFGVSSVDASPIRLTNLPNQQSRIIVGRTNDNDLKAPKN